MVKIIYMRILMHWMKIGKRNAHQIVGMEMTNRMVYGLLLGDK
jgi:hypothetical protein